MELSDQELRRVEVMARQAARKVKFLIPRHLELEDVVQRTLLFVLERYSELTPDDRLLYSQIRADVLDQLKRPCKLFVDGEASSEPTTGWGPEEVVGLGLLLKCVEGLSARHRVMAEMLAMGFSKTEVASELDVCPSRVSQMGHELRRHLQGCGAVCQDRRMGSTAG